MKTKVQTMAPSSHGFAHPPPPSSVNASPRRGVLWVLAALVSHMLVFAAGYAAGSSALGVYKNTHVAVTQAPATHTPQEHASMRQATIQEREGWLIPLGEGGDSRDWLTPLDTVSGGQRLVVYTWANIAMKDFIKNFVLYMRLHNITLYVIGSMDQELTSYLQTLAHEVHFDINVLNLHAGLTTGEFGWNSPAFKAMVRIAWAFFVIDVY
jgi:hypothetical protein